MDDYSLYDYNDVNCSGESYDYFEQIEKEQKLNPSLFSDPFIEIDELKFKNQLLFDKISSISAPSEIYIDIPSNLDYSDRKLEEKKDKSHRINKNQKPNYQKNKKNCKNIKSGGSIHKRRTNYQYNNESYENHNSTKQNMKDSFSFSCFDSHHARPSSTIVSSPNHLSFKDRYNLSLNPKRSKPPEKNLIKRATEMQEKLEKMKKENEKLNRNYRSMLYKVYKTNNDVQILQDALDNSHFERLVLGHYEWSNYAEKSF